MLPGLYQISFKALVISVLTLASTVMARDGSQVIFTDSQAAVLKAQAGTSSVVSRENRLMQPFGIAVRKNGEFVVSDTGCMGLLGVNPVNGDQRMIACGGILGVPFGIATERDGMILVANGQMLLRVNPETGVPAVVSYANIFQVPVAVAVADNGEIYVLDALGAVVRVNPINGNQTLVASGGLLKRPQGIAVKGNSLYVTDVATADMNFGSGVVIQIDITTSKQTVLSRDQHLVGPIGIAIEANGDLIVGDPYTINDQSVDKFDGAIIRIDKNTGAQELIARGSENFVNPRGVAVVQSIQE